MEKTMINMEDINVHMFVYYESTGKFLIDRISELNPKLVYLSLINDNPINSDITEYIKYKFDETRVLHVPNHGSDQYGFFHSFKQDKENTSWILYTHDKHPSKFEWLTDMLDIYRDVDTSLLENRNIGMISAKKWKFTQPTFEELSRMSNTSDFVYRKKHVESMQTIIWLHELEKILLAKHKIGDHTIKYPIFSAGNIFLIRRNILEKAHDCVYEDFFNPDAYRGDGEVQHGLERFYFYVSKCMGYENIFI